MFSLDPRLAEDCVHVKDLAVCRVLLMNNCEFPWLVLVPMREALRELHELGDDFQVAMEEMRRCSYLLWEYAGAHKMNIGALGNMVPQLHIHVIARFENDAAWPNPVWNSGVKLVPYPDTELQILVKELQALIA